MAANKKREKSRRISSSSFCGYGQTPFSKCREKFGQGIDIQNEGYIAAFICSDRCIYIYVYYCNFLDCQTELSCNIVTSDGGLKNCVK